MNPPDPLVSLLPLACVTAWFVSALALFQVRIWRGHGHHDPEVSERPASALLGRYLRHYMMWILSPWERALVRVGIAPNTITLASLLTASGAGLCLARGRFGAGGWLYLVTGMLDILDGRVARRTGRVTASGAYFDSVIDRYAELLVFTGLAFYYRASPVLAVVMVACIGSLMVSYSRARGEALGADVKIGTMQRPERLFYLGAVLAHSPLWEALSPTRQGQPLYPPAVAALVLLGLSANVTALRRIVHTMQILDERELHAARFAEGRDHRDDGHAGHRELVTLPERPEVATNGASTEPVTTLPDRLGGGAVDQPLARLRPAG